MNWKQLAVLIIFISCLFLWNRYERRAEQRKIDNDTKERQKRKDCFVKDLHETKKNKEEK